MAMTKEEIKQFGRWVASERKILGLTQKELAEKLGLITNRIGSIECGSEKAIGDKTVSLFNNFFGKSFNISNSTIQIDSNNVNKNLKDNFSEFLETIACATVDPDYMSKVITIQKTLGVSKESAAKIILENILKK